MHTVDEAGQSMWLVVRPCKGHAAFVHFLPLAPSVVNLVAFALRVDIKKGRVPFVTRKPTFWIALALVSLAGAAFAYRYSPHTFPVLQLDIFARPLF
jgi:hypothetical protein